MGSSTYFLLTVLHLELNLSVHRQLFSVRDKLCAQQKTNFSWNISGGNWNKLQASQQKVLFASTFMNFTFYETATLAMKGFYCFHLEPCHCGYQQFSHLSLSQNTSFLLSLGFWLLDYSPACCMFGGEYMRKEQPTKRWLLVSEAAR